jgi:hypothetical protein
MLIVGNLSVDDSPPVLKVFLSPGTVCILFCTFQITVTFADSRELSDHDEERDDEDEDEDEDDEFHYPSSSSLEAARTAYRASTSTSNVTRPGVSRAPTDLTPQLSQAPDFRVPTHEAPQKGLTSRLKPHHAHAQWERDEAVNQCRGCQRTFNFLNRRVCISFPLKVTCLNSRAACRTLSSQVRWMY